MHQTFRWSDRNSMIAFKPPIYYIRHGQTDWNAARQVQGRTDIPLNETGHAQAAGVARALAAREPDISGFTIYASPLTRVRQTLKYLLDEYGIDDSVVHFDDRLLEVSFGDHEGWTWSELNAIGVEPRKDPESYFHWRPENGESYYDASLRIKSWLADVTGPTIVVAHGGISRILRGELIGKSGAEYVGLKVPQTKYFKIEAGNIEWFDAQ